MDQQSQQRLQWTKADPISLVAAARKSISSGPLQNQPDVIGPLEELVSRFEHQSRATLGAFEIQVGS